MLSRLRRLTLTHPWANMIGQPPRGAAAGESLEGGWTYIIDTTN